MAQTHKDDEMIEENIETQDDTYDEVITEEETKEQENTSVSGDDTSLKERFARLQADYDNFKKRTEREREEMIFFINSKTFSRILPRIDDLERIIVNTPEDLKLGTLFTGVEATYKAFIRDIESLGVKSFISKGQTVDPERHDVMTQVPGEEGIIIDEFEKGYMLGERVIRHAKVVVGSGI